ncbi:phosphotyrosine protein phosphatase [Salipiger sp. CCB-MM3]|uniref:low molecular weight protein-tyrosine-phosphatase n=1 Tax=Roseobacteraceae TaxID=2854170 RepID=UPI00080AA888|nr:MULTISPECIES: low molecular weight protein-tyrosine-phosphatase [Roseobacteraceae]ANT61868.1 phosphotyrosine protein phosphatase [Salipiger sp. CCB-MM3]MCA0997703.1 low molecular weight phosphotyrosine protein phosphatase [Alloyangia pacifica]
MAYRILFVCLGNICRSPSAEGVLRVRAAERGVALEIDSAGTGDWHVGEPPYGPMQRAARTRGYDLSRLRARQVAAEDFHRFDLIIAMDPSNLENLERLRPAQGGAELRLFTDYAPGSGATEVPDPYYTRDFDGTLELIERAAEGLLDALSR